MTHVSRFCRALGLDSCNTGRWPTFNDSRSLPLDKRVSLIVDDEVEYFKEHQEKLVEESSGKVLVIKDQEVIGVYDSELDAYHETDESHEPGTFLIQRAQERERAYTQTFHSRDVA